MNDRDRELTVLALRRWADIEKTSGNERTATYLADVADDIKAKRYTPGAARFRAHDRRIA